MQLEAIKKLWLFPLRITRAFALKKSVRKINKHATQDDLKALLLAFYKFKITTGFHPEPADKDVLANFNANDDIASIHLHCEIIDTSNCSDALKDSARCIKTMFASK
jgi:hypothetical protein